MTLIDLVRDNAIIPSYSSGMSLRMRAVKDRSPKCIAKGIFEMLVKRFRHSVEILESKNDDLDHTLNLTNPAVIIGRKALRLAYNFTASIPTLYIPSVIDAIQPVAETEVLAVEKLVQIIRELNMLYENENQDLEMVSNLMIDDTFSDLIQELKVVSKNVKTNLDEIEGKVRDVVEKKVKEAKDLSKDGIRTWQDHSLESLKATTEDIKVSMVNLHQEIESLRNHLFMFRDFYREHRGKVVVLHWRNVFQSTSENFLENIKYYELTLNNQRKLALHPSVLLDHAIDGSTRAIVEETSHIHTFQQSLDALNAFHDMQKEMSKLNTFNKQEIVRLKSVVEEKKSDYNIKQMISMHFQKMKSQNIQLLSNQIDLKHKIQNLKSQINNVHEELNNTLTEVTKDAFGAEVLTINPTDQPTSILKSELDIEFTVHDTNDDTSAIIIIITDLMNDMIETLISTTNKNVV